MIILTIPIDKDKFSLIYKDKLIRPSIIAIMVLMYKGRPINKSTTRLF